MRTCSCHAVSAISPARGCCVSAQSKTIKQHEIRESISVRGNRGAVFLLGVQSAGQGGFGGGQSRRTLLSSSASSAPAETLLGAQLLISVWMQRLVPTCVRITEFRCSNHPRSVRTVKHLSGSSDERARLYGHTLVFPPRLSPHRRPRAWLHVGYAPPPRAGNAQPTRYLPRIACCASLRAPVKLWTREKIDAFQTL